METIPALYSCTKAYRQEMQQRLIANEQLLSAEMSEDTTWTWGWWY